MSHDQSTDKQHESPMPASDFRLMSEPEKYGAYASAYRRVVALEREVERLREYQRKVEEAEGRCCPEDYGFEEWIAFLKRQVGERDVTIANLTAAVTAMNGSPETKLSATPASDKKQREPVAWFRIENGMRVYYETEAWPDMTPLYVAPSATPASDKLESIRDTLIDDLIATKRARQATPAENMEVLYARLNEKMSPAERRELQEVIAILKTTPSAIGASVPFDTSFITSDGRPLLAELDNIALFLDAEKTPAAARVVEDARRRLEEIAHQATVVFRVMSMEAGERAAEFESLRSANTPKLTCQRCGDEWKGQACVSDCPLWARVERSATTALPDDFTLRCAEELFGAHLGAIHENGIYECACCEQLINIHGWVTAKHADNCFINTVRDYLAKHKPECVPGYKQSQYVGDET